MTTITQNNQDSISSKFLQFYKDRTLLAVLLSLFAVMFVYGIFFTDNYLTLTNFKAIIRDANALVGHGSSNSAPTSPFEILFAASSSINVGVHVPSVNEIDSVGLSKAKLVNSPNTAFATRCK